MFVTESQAKQKFCPLGRGALKLSEGKFATANMEPGERVLTFCKGTGCMLFHIATRQESMLPCPSCDGHEKRKLDCQPCHSTGFIKIIEPVGYCGAGVDEMGAHSLKRLAESSEMLCNILGAPLVKPTLWARFRALFKPNNPNGPVGTGAAPGLAAAMQQEKPHE